MPLQHHFSCPLPNGIHARPASLLEDLSRNFNSAVTLINQRTGREANCKSVLSIISADIRHNDPCLLTVSGPDEQNALSKMSTFVDDTFPHCDDDLPATSKLNGHAHLPPGLNDTNLSYWDGTPIVPGIASGKIFLVGGFNIPAGLQRNGVKDVDAEWRLMHDALNRLAAFYTEHLNAAKGKLEAEMLMAHRAIARDLEFRRRLQEGITQKLTAAGAIADTQSYFSKMLAGSESMLLRERVLDIQDVCFQLLHEVYGDKVNDSKPALSSDSIIVAESLTPRQFLALDRQFLKGLVLAHAGVTSHTVILARSFGVPTLTGVTAVTTPDLDGREAVLDAYAGMLVLELTDPVRRYYAMESRRIANRQAHIKKHNARSCETKDGKPFEIAANIATADEAAIAFAAGAESIGLFRTEMLFLDRNSAPDEEEQFQTYCRVLKAAGNRTVIIRTLDAGGDKPLSYLKPPVEENPFLGYRAVRIYPEFETLFRTQIRALIRASARGQLKILIPMIAIVDEARWVKKIIAEEHSRCIAQKIECAAAIPIGAMIEVPSAAFAMEDLCREMDFFSIGSNDLLQYFVAADRANTRVSGLYNPSQPAFLRMLKQVVDVARANGKWIGLCGEMAGQLRSLPLLIGLGLDEISVAAPSIADLTAESREWTLPKCQQLLSTVLKCSTAGEVDILLKRSQVREDVPLIEPEFILIDQQAASKAEAIKLAADQLYVLGRTDNSRELEEAIWQRERAYSTGFGHGFAIPHCKTDAVRFNSLVLVKLKTPVEWDAIDGKPVNIVILLVIRESNTATSHMKILAKLARNAMNDDFRARIESDTDSYSLYGFLKENLAVE